MKEGRLPARDFFKDIVSSLKISGRRSLLSGAVTVWGVFVFVVITGTSNGIDRGNRSNDDHLIQYGILSVYPGEVSIPYGGSVKGRVIQFTENDADELKKIFSDYTDGIYPRKLFNAFCKSPTGFANMLVSDFRTGLDERYIDFLAGRCLNEVELSGDGRVCLIPKYLAGQLYGNAREAVGRTLIVDGLPFVITGVYKPAHDLSFKCVFVPFKTAMQMREADGDISFIDIKLPTEMAAAKKRHLKDEIHSLLCFNKGLDPKDLSALRLEDKIEFISEQEKFIASIRIFTLFVSLLSLLMGVLGVSSIIHLSVKERTKEIAVRLICGSSDRSIFFLVLGESVATMLSFGFAGLLLGTTALNIATSVVNRLNEGVRWIMISNLNVNLGLIVNSVILIVLCGLASGFAPARKAMSIKVNEALSCE
ncbi:MAG: ABC transporter permease [Bacteroidales bacterium]|nr:ABC transporter permease [Bacteroidales bacterium]